MGPEGIIFSGGNSGEIQEQEISWVPDVNSANHLGVIITKTKVFYCWGGWTQWSVNIDPNIIGEPMPSRISFGGTIDKNPALAWKGTVDNIKVYNIAKLDDPSTAFSGFVFDLRHTIYQRKIFRNRLGSDCVIRANEFGTGGMINGTVPYEFLPGGTIYGTVAYGGGKFGKGVYANQTTNSVTFQVLEPNAKKFGTDQLTIEFWAKTWGINQNSKYLFDLSVGGSTPLGRLNFAQRGATGFSVGGAAVNNAAVTNHTWVHNVLNHYAMTVSKTDVKVYINGVEKYSSPIRPEVIGQSIPNILTLCGNGLTMSANKWNGVIDNLKVYNYPKTDFSDRMKE